MTLAVQCEAIWPCGWSGGHRNYARSRALRRLVEVTYDQRKYLAFFHGERCLGDADLRALLVAVRAKLAEDLKLPDILEEA